MGLAAAPCRRRRCLLFMLSFVLALICIAESSGTATNSVAASGGGIMKIIRARRLSSVATNDYDIPRANPGHQPTAKAKPKPQPQPKPKPKPKPKVTPVKQKQKRN